jgi:DNA replication protein DnaC
VNALANLIIIFHEVSEDEHEKRWRPDEAPAKMMPAHVEPAFKTGEELLAWQKEQGKLRSEALERENRAMKMQRTFNRSGIRPLHQNCSL